MTYRQFEFNPFAENTYLLWDETKEALLLDPGMSNDQERQQVLQTLEDEGLTLKHVWLTHAHVDHIAGLPWVAQTFGLQPWLHPLEENWLKMAEQQGAMFGFRTEAMPQPAGHLQAPGTQCFGNTELELRFTPGHSEGSISFYHAASQTLFSGDALFAGSIGRTDLPGGDLSTLLSSIQEQIMTLPDEVTVLSGHGPATTVGRELATNPFLQPGAIS